MSDYLVKEDGGHLELEDGSGGILLEQQAALPRTGTYLVQESDGVSRFVLEDGTGCIIIETPVVQSPTGGSFAIAVRRPARRLVIAADDELIALTLAVRGLRRRRSK